MRRFKLLLSSIRRMTIVLIAAVLFLVSVPIFTTMAFADDAGVAAVAPDQGTSAATPPVDTTDDVISASYEAITTSNWFMAAGALLAGVTIGVRWLLAKKWKGAMSDPAGVIIVGALAVTAALGHAWMAKGLGYADSHTFIGALKVMIAAISTYVVPKKLLSTQGLLADEPA